MQFFIHASNSSTFSSDIFLSLCFDFLFTFSFSYDFFALAADSPILKKFINRKKQEPKTPDPALFSSKMLLKDNFASCLITVPLFISFHVLIPLYCNKHMFFFFVVVPRALIAASLTSLIRYTLSSILPLTFWQKNSFAKLPHGCLLFFIERINNFFIPLPRIC